MDVEISHPYPYSNILIFHCSGQIPDTGKGKRFEKIKNFFFFEISALKGSLSEEYMCRSKRGYEDGYGNHFLESDRIGTGV